ncbi:MAG: hypothetical protein Q7T99_18465 [Pseudomonas sp.]|nr:hypothetical protein [Pseudomonas sp.]
MGSVSAGEIIRHLAILGSCAAVSNDATDSTYYLGRKGRLKVVRHALPDDTEGAFHATSEVISYDRKSLVAHSTVIRGHYIAHFYGEYQVLPSPVFARTFRHYRTEPVTAPAQNPHGDPIGLDFDAPHEKTLVARSQPLANSRFAGHFSEYPAWPASLYCETVSRVAGRLLEHMLERNVHFMVARMDIDPVRLISAAERVSFHVTCISASNLLNRYVFHGQVRHEDMVVALVEMEIYI